MTLIRDARDVVMRQYGGAIGESVERVTTPALLLDLPAAKRNIRRMQEGIAPFTTTLRPHVKTHKSPDLALLQAEAGAVGFSTATVWEAVMLAEAGLDDFFVVNTIAGPAKIARLAELARGRRVRVAIDSMENATQLSEAAVRAGATIGVLVEIDTGMRRCGLDDPMLAAKLVVEVQDLQGLRFDGVTGYEGHCSLEDDVAQRTLKQRKAMEVLFSAVEAIASAGVPCPIVSAGGTRTWWLTAATEGITEIQAGTYVLMDRFHSGLAGGFEPAARIATTVISRSRDRVIVDAGSKSVADSDLAVIEGLEDAPNFGFDEEHGRFGFSEFGTPSLGEVVQLLPGYIPSTINFYDAYHVVENGVVVDIWPIIPRGPGHYGLAGKHE